MLCGFMGVPLGKPRQQLQVAGWASVAGASAGGQKRADFVPFSQPASAPPSSSLQLARLLADFMRSQTLLAACYQLNLLGT